MICRGEVSRRSPSRIGSGVSLTDTSRRKQNLINIRLYKPEERSRDRSSFVFYRDLLDSASIKTMELLWKAWSIGKGKMEA